MAKIQIKRGQNVNLPATLDAGEPAFALDSGKLWVGTGTSKKLINPDKVSAAALADKLAHSRTIAINGDVTGTGNFDGTKACTIEAKLQPSGVSCGTYPKVTVDKAGRVVLGGCLQVKDIPSIPASKVTGLGSASAHNAGVTEGTVPVLGTGGKLPNNVIPAIAITDTFVVSSQSKMLALDAQRGDIAIRSDLRKCYVLAADGAGTLANWKELITPTDAVLSVNGQKGAVLLNKSDVGLTNVDNVKQYSTSNPPPYPVTSVKGEYSTSQTGDVVLNLSAVAGCNMTGGINNSHTAIATNDWVNDQHFIKESGVVDGGSF